MREFSVQQMQTDLFLLHKQNMILKLFIDTELVTQMIEKLYKEKGY